MTETPTSYSLLVMFRDVIYAVRDPYGNRPLCIGRLVPISKLYSSGTFSMSVHVSDPLLQRNVNQKVFELFEVLCRFTAEVGW